MAKENKCMERDNKRNIKIKNFINNPSNEKLSTPKESQLDRIEAKLDRLLALLEKK